MKKVIATVLFGIIAATASAQTEPKGFICFGHADMFSRIVVQRDLFETPEQTFVKMKSFVRRYFNRDTNLPISDRQIKAAVNMVYFDKEFAAPIDIHQMSAQIYKLCVNDWEIKPQFQPLK